MGPLILTNIGLAKLASATPENQLEIKSVAVGDSDAPIDPTNTALNNEVWRGDSSLPIRDPMDAKVLIFEGVIPASVGGFTIREVGLFDVDGDLIAIGHTSEIDKPAPSAGTPITLTARVRLMLDNASQTDLIIADAPLIDHQGTSNRDASDAHPISAITGLTAELGLKANTADLGQGAFFDEATIAQAQLLTAGNRVMTPRRVADALNWRGLNLTKRWQLPEASEGWYKFATVRGGSYSDHGVFFIDQLARTVYVPTSARIEFGGHPTSGHLLAYSLVSYPSGPGYGDIAYHHIGNEDFDLYVRLGADVNPVVEFTGSPGSLINTDPIPGVTSLPSDAVIVPRATDWNSQSMAQTWQDMTASRALGTDYVNNTGRPIHVSVAVNRAAGSTAAYADIRVDGQVVSQFKASSDTGQVYGPLYAIVPPGATYKATTSGASTDSAVLSRWSEYR